MNRCAKSAMTAPSQTRRRSEMSKEKTYGLRGHTLAQIIAKSETDGPGFPPWRVDTVHDLAVALEQAEAKLKEVRGDTARLNWIDQNMDCTLHGPGLSVSLVEIGNRETLRQAIDRAIADREG